MTAATLSADYSSDQYALLLSLFATHWCKSRGIKVGQWGASPGRDIGSCRGANKVRALLGEVADEREAEAVHAKLLWDSFESTRLNEST